jgi:uncharacterized protein YgbK (DUF1537 family)
VRDSQPAAADVFANLPRARPDDEALRESIRRLRAEDRRFIGVLDDDPTGSQAVHAVQVVTVLEEDAYQAALDGPAGTCFVLTNSRSLGQRAAGKLTKRAARGLIAVAGRRGARIDLISRSDSTLRGHLLEEVAALAAVHRDTLGGGPDGVLLAPAFIEAGRLTAGDIHWARTPAGLVPVGETEFARDRVFGYAASNLREFIAEKSGGAIGADGVRSISLADIRLGGLPRIRDVLASTRDGTWLVVNATEYSDLEAVAHAVLLAEREGQSFLFRTGPSFVRALSGIGPRAPLRGQEISAPAGRGGHGLIVVGSHVAQTKRQVADLRARGGITGIELDAASVVKGSGDVAAAEQAAERAAEQAAEQVVTALGHSDVLLYTSRAVVSAGDGRDDLAIGRTVSGALASITRRALAARPAWIIAKGGITSHDVATHGLGIRRAEVAGQLFPGLISVFRPADAAPEAIGIPYVVFPGNVGDDQALTRVVAILTGAGPLAHDPGSERHCRRVPLHSSSCSNPRSWTIWTKSSAGPPRGRGDPSSCWPGREQGRPGPWWRARAGCAVRAWIRAGSCCSPSPAGQRTRCCPGSPRRPVWHRLRGSGAARSTPSRTGSSASTPKRSHCRRSSRSSTRVT